MKKRPEIEYNKLWTYGNGEEDEDHPGQIKLIQRSHSFYDASKRLVLDIETEPIPMCNPDRHFNPGQVYPAPRPCFGVIRSHKDYAEGNIGERMRLDSPEDVKKCYDRIQELADEKFFFVVHNLRFDITILFGNMIISKNKGRKPKWIRSGGRFLSYTFGGAPGRKDKKVIRHKRIKIYDSLNIIPDSLASIGENVELRKLDSDYNYVYGEEPKEEDWVYCERDCDIVHKALDLMEKVIMEIAGVKLKMTISSTGFEALMYDMQSITQWVWRYKKPLKSLSSDVPQEDLPDTWKWHFWDKEKPDQKYAKFYNNPVFYRFSMGMWMHKDLYNSALRSYLGGMTRTYEPGAHHGDFVLVDINSSYPASGCDDFPDPKWARNVTNPSMRKIIDNLDRYEGFVKLKLKSFSGKHPFLGIVEKNRIVYPNDKAIKERECIKWMSFPEFRCIINPINDMGVYDLDVMEMVCSKRIKSPFSKTLQTWFEKRKELKKTQPAIAYAVKILLNGASYGKHIEMRNDIDDFIEDVDGFLKTRTRKKLGETPDDVMKRHRKYLNWFDDHFRSVGDNPNQGFLRSEERPANHMLPPVAAYITGRSRVPLWEHSSHTLYCDTDSIVCTKKYMETDVIDIGSGLGQFDVEIDSIHTAELYGKKYYRLRYIDEKGRRAVKARIKGVSIKPHIDPRMKNDEVAVMAHYERMGSIDMKKPKTYMPRQIGAYEAVTRGQPDMAGKFMELDKKLTQYDEETWATTILSDNEIMAREMTRKYNQRGTLDYFSPKTQRKHIIMEMMDGMEDLYDEKLSIEENAQKTLINDIARGTN